VPPKKAEQNLNGFAVGEITDTWFDVCAKINAEARRALIEREE
jgi:hypothetical protein